MEGGCWCRTQGQWCHPLSKSLCQIPDTCHTYNIQLLSSHIYRSVGGRRGAELKNTGVILYLNICVRYLILVITCNTSSISYSQTGVWNCGIVGGGGGGAEPKVSGVIRTGGGRCAYGTTKGQPPPPPYRHNHSHKHFLYLASGGLQPLDT